MGRKTAGGSPDFLTVGALARKLSVCQDTIRRMDGVLAPLRTGEGARLYPPSAVAKARATLRKRHWWRKRRREGRKEARRV